MVIPTLSGTVGPLLPPCSASGNLAVSSSSDRGMMVSTRKLSPPFLSASLKPREGGRLLKDGG